MVRIASIAVPLSLLLAAAAPPDPAVGRWNTPTHRGVIDIAPCGASVCGRVAGFDLLDGNPALQDGRNTDPSLRGRRLAGLLVLRDFVAADDGGWRGGTIYNPEDGRTYHARITPLDADHLRVRGCVMVPLCRSQVWTRAR